MYMYMYMKLFTHVHAIKIVFTDTCTYNVDFTDR